MAPQVNYIMHIQCAPCASIQVVEHVDSTGWRLQAMSAVTSKQARKETVWAADHQRRREIQLQESNVRQLAITRERAWHWALESAKQRQAYCLGSSIIANPHAVPIITVSLLCQTEGLSLLLRMLLCHEPVYAPTIIKGQVWGCIIHTHLIG